MDQSGASFQIDEARDRGGYTVDLMDRTFRAYPIMEEELDSLASTHSSVNQVFLGIVLGALISVVVNLWTGAVTAANAVAYTWIAVGLGLASLYFGVCSIGDAISARGRVKRIRNRGATGPNVGRDAREVAP